MLHTVSPVSGFLYQWPPNGIEKKRMGNRSKSPFRSLSSLHELRAEVLLQYVDPGRRPWSVQCGNFMEHQLPPFPSCQHPFPYSNPFLSFSGYTPFSFPFPSSLPPALLPNQGNGFSKPPPFPFPLSPACSPFFAFCCSLLLPFVSRPYDERRCFLFPKLPGRKFIKFPGIPPRECSFQQFLPIMSKQKGYSRPP